VNVEFNKFSLEIWRKKYFTEGENSPDDVFRRVAKAIAGAESPEKFADFQTEFYYLLSSMCFIPGGRIVNGAGTSNPFLLNCYFEPIPDSLEGIMEALKRAAIIFKKNGGVGYNFSSLRPADHGLSGGGTSSGPISFMDMFDAMGNTIKSGGFARRAAQMGILNCDHGDIEAFVGAKRVPGKLENFNISIGITENFIDAVKNDLDWDLKWKDEVVKTVKAKALWKKFIVSQYEFNDPGFFNLSEINKYNNMWYRYYLDGCNPCGEIVLAPYGVCDLGNINITMFVKKPFFDWRGSWLSIPFEEAFDIGAYKDTIVKGVRFLDDVLDVTEYPFEENRQVAQEERRIGLNGFSGLGSALAMMMMEYGSPESLAFIDYIGEVFMETAYNASIDLAIEKGSFGVLEIDKFMQSGFIKKLSPETQKHLKKHGIRNCSLGTIPPVGTGSIIANNISSGGEPIFALEYVRQVLNADGTKTPETVEDYAWGLYKSIFGATIKSPIPAYFKASREIEPKRHIDVQAGCQKWIDQSISKTVNLPKDITVEDYEKLVMYAFEKGCKGFTSFREGTREGVLSVKDEKRTVIKVKAEEPKKKRPRVLDGKTIKVSDDKGNLYVTINSVEEKGKVRPYEIFLNSNGENSEYMPWYRAMSKLMSAVMRRTDNCDFLVKDLLSIYGEKGYWADGRYILSQPQMVGMVLEEYMKSLNPSTAMTEYSRCPECRDNAFIKEAGCGKCVSCGYSSCS
jgi:ribonucleoside-diphosphate reductase alpha chain